MRKQLVSGKKLLLFVDTGDNCRCPLAIGYLTKLLAQRNIDYIELRHMGVMTPNDLLPTPEVVQLLKEEGVDIRYHRSRPVNDDLIRQADLVLGFTAIHVQTCLRRVPESKGKVHLLKQYVGLEHTGDQIHDPMGSTMEIFKKYFAEIKASLHKLVEMEFITEPPEPKEVVIAPTVSKPRPLAEEEEAEEKPKQTRARSADSEKPAAKTRKSAAADKEEAKPAKAKATAKKTTAAAGAKKAAAAKPAAEKAKKEKPKAAKTTAKATTTKATAAKAKPAKASAAKTAKPAKAAAKPAAKKPAAKAATAKTTAAKVKTKTAAAPKAKAKPATAKAKAPAKAASTKAATAKPAAKAKTAAKAAPKKTTKSKK